MPRSKFLHSRSNTLEHCTLDGLFMLGMHVDMTKHGCGTNTEEKGTRTGHEGSKQLGALRLDVLRRAGPCQPRIRPSCQQRPQAQLLHQPARTK